MNKEEIAIQGVAGSFHHIAAQLYSGNQNVNVLGFDDFESLALEVTYKKKLGLMAIENSLVGSLMDNYRLLNKYDLHVTGEVYLRIEQNLLGIQNSDISELREVYSHPMALAQCADFFNHYPHIKLIESEDTAESAARVSHSKNKSKGAIASKLASEMYELDILAKGIESNKKNYTRFLAISSEPIAHKNKKASISFTLKHEPGSLYKFLELAFKNDLNLTKIQSTPIVGQPWSYRFFVDLSSSAELDRDGLSSILEPQVQSLSILGIYEPGENFSA